MPSLDALARENGTFLMVAMDQRESLRAMLAQHHPEPIEDDQLVRFKVAVARELSPYASGFLIDRRFGFDEVVRRGFSLREPASSWPPTRSYPVPKGRSLTPSSTPRWTPPLRPPPARWRSSC